MTVLPILLCSLTAAAVHSGVQNQLRVAVPRIEAAADIDGALDEAVWQQAAVLTGFSQYAPVDGRPADDVTEVLVWYSPTAMYFGIRAHAATGTVRATLADRDKIDSDDFIQIFLSTFNDGRQALMFGVNPFGVQTDGALMEGTRTQGGGFSGLSAARETADLTPDFVFDSKGRLTDYGYEIEIRIPFKSLRYQTADPQTWGIHVVRRSQSSGREDSWVPARRAGTSFLSQAGRLEGLTDLRRGLVLDVNPVVTAKIDGTPDADGWRYETGSPEFGANVRWGVTTNLTLNGTVNPDFSQVESDAGQFVFDPRSALFFPEKRPFFLDGIEQFSTPNRLIYTRRIVAPLAAAKLTGKIAGTTLAALSAVDDAAASAMGNHPVFNLLRLQRDLGTESRAGLVYTDKVDGPNFNRVFGVDARISFRRLYSVQLQGAMSHTRLADVTTTAPLWEAILNRNGRNFGFRYQWLGIDDAFRASSGFISRGGIVRLNIDHRLTKFGPPGGLVESWSGDVVLDGIWQYSRFTSGDASQDRKLHFNNNFAVRGGWKAGGSVLVETFGFDDRFYADYALERSTASGAEIVSFTGTPTLANLDYVVTLTTPEFQTFSASVFYLWGKDENFFEWSPADIVFANVGLNWRPTDQIRINGTYQLQQFKRRTDGSVVGVRRIPRLKVEYQLTRAMFVRMVGEYDSEAQDNLRDDSRTNLPIVIIDRRTNVTARAQAFHRNTFRADWLFAYQPSPGTVLFAGYGSTLAEPDPRRVRGLRRASDGFFLKLSYLFRI